MLVALLAAGCGQRPPSTPVIGGDATGQPFDTLVVRVVSTDPNQDNISYHFDFGDGSASFWTAELAAGDTFLQRHVYLDTGRFTLLVNARDETGLQSSSGAQCAVSIVFLGPLAPASPAGPAETYRDVPVVFEASAGHVRDESVSLQFDWGDTLGDWTAFVAPGTLVSDSCAYPTLGARAVRARARDRNGTRSPWSRAAGLLVIARPLAPPHDLRLSASDGVMVRLRWTPGVNDDTVTSVVRFRAVWDSVFVPAGEADGSSFLHDPLGGTGDYLVGACRGADTALCTETLTTVPVFTDTLQVGELNSGLASGYGWDTTCGQGASFPMQDSAAAGRVDWYFTDLSSGHVGPAFYIVSPRVAPGDPGGTAPAADWRRSRMLLVTGSGQGPLPKYDSLHYQNVVDVSGREAEIAVHTVDDRYALIASDAPNTNNGTVRVRSWFQLVPGLQLIRHPVPELR